MLNLANEYSCSGGLGTPSTSSGSFFSSVSISVPSNAGTLGGSCCRCQWRKTRSSDRAPLVKGAICLKEWKSVDIHKGETSNLESTHHGRTLNLLIHFGRPLYRFSLMAMGGARSPRSAYSSRVIPSDTATIRLNHFLGFRQCPVHTWSFLRDFLLFMRPGLLLLPLCGQIQHVANIRGGHDGETTTNNRDLRSIDASRTSKF